MRSQACTIQQALTPEAMAVVKQAVALAKRRGHAQVTPLHVAHTMLAVSSGLFRAACLQAHSHPLQCRALELCFNVALNRLPTTTASGPMLGPLSAHHHQYPTIANALVAAFKRAQAHQRRGSIENQQQPLLAVKIELEQLIISILDDPSVSRVMKEAGFSSPLVKAKVEQAISTELGSQNQAQNNNNNNNNNNKKLKDSSNTCSTPTNSCNSVLCMAQVGLKMEKVRPSDQGGVRKEDIMTVIESLMDKRKRNRVVVGECVSTLEGLVRQVMDRVEKGEVPEGLKDVNFVPLSFSSFGHLSREEVEQKVRELKCLVKSCCVDNNKGVILYLDDLKWVNEFRANSNSNSNNILGDHQPPPRNIYCPIEHVIMEIGKLVLGYAECGKLWLLGIATFQTYMRCRSGQSSLEAIWGLHAITIPAGSLGLSLLPDSDVPSPLPSKKADMTGRSWLTLEDQSGGGAGGGGFDNSWPSGTVNMEERSRQSSGCNSESTTSSLPSWLQQYKDENSKRLVTNLNNDDQDSVPVKDLGKRWSSICTSSSHIYPPTPSFQRTPSFSSISPPSTSDYSYDQNYLKLHPTHQSLEPKNFWLSESLKKGNEPPFTMYIQANNKEHKQLDLPQQRHTTPFVSSSNPSSTTPTSTSSSDIMMDQSESQCALESFKEFNGDNLKALCSALEQKVPHQKDIIFEIVSTILQCRSGMATRKGSTNNHLLNKEETWLFFQGVDFDAKEKIARELARIIFGSQDKFVSIALSSFSSTRVEYSLEDCRNKRLRDEQSCSYIERFAKAVSSDPHRVFFIEDIDQVDYSSQIGIKKAIERGRIPKYSNGEDVSFGDAIIILSCESFRSRSRACSPSTKHKFHMVSPPHHHDHDHQKFTTKDVDHSGASNLKEITTSPSIISLDLNLSINDDNDDDIVNDVGNAIQGQSMDEIGLLASVDRCIVFKY